jgi:hypothetical protein
VDSEFVIACWHVRFRGSMFPFCFLYSDCVRHVSDRISLFSNPLVFRKFVFVFVFDLIEFALIFVFKCESLKNIGVISTELVCFQP